jgi:hypothetical protein
VGLSATQNVRFHQPLRAEISLGRTSDQANKAWKSRAGRPARLFASFLERSACCAEIDWNMKAPGFRCLTHAIMFDADAASRLAMGMFLKASKTPRWNVWTAMRSERGTDLEATQIVSETTYVGRMTTVANRAKRQACQGLHNGPVLAYGFWRAVPLTVDCHLS